jgi:rRNA maturation RNase YbeY
LAVRFFSDGISFQLVDKRKISQWLKQVLAGEGKKAGDLCYVFVPDGKILDINRQFLHHNYYTDIITFDYSTDKAVSGEMYISIDTVQSNAREYQTGFHDELLRVMVHGLLHLCGYNDRTKKERQQMRAAETKYLDIIFTKGILSNNRSCN